MESDTFYGDFMVKLVWRLSGVFMEKTWEIKSPDNLHKSIAQPLYCLHAVCIISTYYGHEMIFQGSNPWERPWKNRKNRENQL